MPPIRNFYRAKRRERDNARKAQSRRWYYEKADWIVSDEIEDEELDLSEEEVILEQSLEVPTVKVKTNIITIFWRKNTLLIPLIFSVIWKINCTVFGSKRLRVGSWLL